MFQMRHRVARAGRVGRPRPAARRSMGAGAASRRR